MPLIFLYLWVILIYLTAYYLELILIKTFSTKLFRIFVAPGIVIHELSHILGAKLSGSKIADYRFFDPKGGYVKFTKPKIPLIGNAFISFAPLIIGSLVILLLGLLLNIKIAVLSNGQSLQQFFTIIGKINFFSIPNIIVLYLIMSIAAALAPSKQDFTIAWAGLIPFIIITVLFYLFIPYTIILINLLSGLYFICLTLICGILIIALIMLGAKKVITKR